jgi:hypothetical protein
MLVDLADPYVLTISGFVFSTPPGDPSTVTRLMVFLTPDFLFGFLFLGIFFSVGLKYNVKVTRL